LHFNWKSRPIIADIISDFITVKHSSQGHLEVVLFTVVFDSVHQQITNHVFESRPIDFQRAKFTLNENLESRISTELKSQTIDQFNKIHRLRLFTASADPH